MQFCKVKSYNLKVFKIIYNVLTFPCGETTLHYPLECILSQKAKKTGKCLKHITPVSNSITHSLAILITLSVIRSLSPSLLRMSSVPMRRTAISLLLFFFFLSLTEYSGGSVSV